MTDLLPAILRTIVPAIYGWLILHFGIDRWVSSDIAQPLIGLAIFALIYIILRELEKLEPRFGVLLGWIGAPQYATVVDDDLEKWRSATKAEVIEELGKIKDEILGHVETIVGSVVGSVVDEKVTQAAASVPALDPAAATKMKKADLVAYVSGSAADTAKTS